MKIYEDGIEREATADQAAEIEARQAEAAKQQTAEAKEAAARAKTKADVLAKLGLTADEVAALLS
jgi:hypothetical protein